MNQQKIELRGNAQPGGSSFEAVTTELSDEQLSNVLGGKGLLAHACATGKHFPMVKLIT